MLLFMLEKERCIAKFDPNLELTQKLVCMLKNSTCPYRPPTSHEKKRKNNLKNPFYAYGVKILNLS